jgi:hypothetical protein
MPGKQHRRVGVGREFGGADFRSKRMVDQIEYWARKARTQWLCWPGLSDMAQIETMLFSRHAGGCDCCEATEARERVARAATAPWHHAARAH